MEIEISEVQGSGTTKLSAYTYSDEAIGGRYVMPNGKLAFVTSVPSGNKKFLSFKSIDGSILTLTPLTKIKQA